jgi:hypothetical protein
VHSSAVPKGRPRPEPGLTRWFHPKRSRIVPVLQVCAQSSVLPLIWPLVAPRGCNAGSNCPFPADRCVYCDCDTRRIMLLRELLARPRKAAGLAQAA